MNASRLFDLLIALMYLAGSVIYPLGLGLSKPHLKRAATLISAAAFVLHSADLVLRLFQTGSATLTQGQFYLSLLAWFVVLIFFVLWWKLKHDFLSMITAPLALFLFSSSLAVHTNSLSIPKHLSVLWFSLHVGTIFVALALMSMAFGAGVAYLYLERKIKTKAKLPQFSRGLPALETFDKANHWAVAIGFPLYSVSILAGFVWASLTWKHTLSWDPKELVTIGILLLFAFLFHQRMAFGWKGHKPAKLAIIIFLLSMVSLLGVNFLLPSHHSFRL